MFITTSESITQTRTLAEQFLEESLHSNVIGLIGELGSGKTTFTQQVGKILKVDRTITSPTFLIYKQYPIQFKTFSQLIHADLYRLKTIDELKNTGLIELWEEASNLVLIEWADRLQEYLPKNTQYIQFKYLGENIREISFE